MIRQLPILLWLFPLLLAGQNSPEIDYNWAHNYNVKSNIPYGEEDAQKLDIYVQGDWVGEPNFFVEDPELKPTLVYFHGGAWLYQSKEDFINMQFLVYFMQKGWNIVNVEYRLGQDTAPQAADDVMCSLKWIADNAADYHIDPERIVLTGPSAGGHLALIAGLMNSVPESHPCSVGDQLTVNAIINWFGASDIGSLSDYYDQRGNNSVKRWVGDDHTVADISRKYSPIHYVTENAPPILSIHGDLDSVIPYRQSEALHRALDEAKVNNQLLTLTGGKHLGFTDAQFQHINEQIFSFLAAVMD